jgi:hypothetical protein
MNQPRAAAARALALAALCVPLFAQAAAPSDEQAPPASASKPVSSAPHAELLARAKALGGVATWMPYGRSRQGLELFALRIAGAAQKAEELPAILVVANVDGTQPWTSALALQHAEQLVARASEPTVSALLDTTCIYVVPCANPDAHERRFAAVQHEREATGPGVDNDRDGRSGEDPASDLNGDGRITQLRVRDPRGEWIADPLDERALVKADKTKGERGVWRVWTEGRDLDRDERVAEDEPFDACVNRNFAAEWKELAPESGAFPTDEPETLALCEFVLQRPEIALVVTYGAFDNLVEKPKSVAADAMQKRVPQAGVVEADAVLLAEYGKRYAELTGVKHKGRGGDAGSWQTWAYAHRGLWSLAINPWDIPLDAPEKSAESKSEAKAEEGAAAPAKPETDKKEKKDKREPSEDAKRLRWIDANADEGWRFVPWQAFEHPELGACEIGGFAPFARNEPPAARSAELAAAQFEFLLTLGADLPRVRIEEFTAKALGGDLHELRARIVNPSRLPLQNASALRTEAVRPARVDLELGAGASLVAGERLHLIRALDGSGGRFEARWLVRAASLADVRLKLSTQHAGSDARVAELAR